MLTRLRSIGVAIAALASLRAELFGIELREQFDQWLRVAVLAVAAVVLGCLGLGFVAVLLCVAFWESHPLWVLGGCAAAFLGAALWCVRGLSSVLARAPAPFAQTVAEFRRDIGRLDDTQ